jgi:hypothetical protein
VGTRDISFVTARKRVALRLKSFRGELLLRSLAEARPDKMHVYEVHTHEIYAYEVYSYEMRVMPIRYTPMRCMPMKYIPMRYTLVRCIFMGYR